MKTKPKLKLIPLPKGYPALPSGNVHLGVGCAKIRSASILHPECALLACDGPSDFWEQGNWSGSCTQTNYAAPADSAIAREILGVKPKKKAAKTLRKLPKNVKPGTRVVCVDDRLTSLLKKGGEYVVLREFSNRDLLLEGHGNRSWSRERFRLPPAKPRVKRTKSIGVMPAKRSGHHDFKPVCATRYESDREKFGEAFALLAYEKEIDLPDWLLALPLTPAGFHRLEPRGFAWQSESNCVFFCCSKHSPMWEVSSGMHPAKGCKSVFYIEAVRDEREAKPEYAIAIVAKDASGRSPDPKGAAGDLKPQLALIPPAFSEEVAKALQDGKLKYGERNWLTGDGVEMMTYLHAMYRHLGRLIDGEDIDENGAHHLGSIGAGAAIILDARRHGKLIDNRVIKTIESSDEKALPSD